MASIKGIGGVFIYSNDPQRLAHWYEQNLGLSFETMPDGNSYYVVLFSRDYETSVIRGNPVFAINPTEQQKSGNELHYMINFRVDNLDEYLKELELRGVAYEEEILVWERGKHAWVNDLEGNRIELYEEILQKDENAHPNNE
jgi:predicted enzyme related to lactoylglutathione lyase